MPFLRNIITVDSKLPGCLTWEEALALADKVPLAEVQRRAQAISRHDVCNIQYTSGTTGFPKGVMLTHYNVVNNGKCIGDCMDLSTADKMLVQVPMFHCFGMVLSMTAAMTHGATLVQYLIFRRKPHWLASIKKRSPAATVCPPCLSPCWSTRISNARIFSHMRTGIMAGSHLSYQSDAGCS